MVEKQINLNGEFLGISALAIYSAPWFLQLPLLLLVAAMFFAKISRHSKDIRAETEKLKSGDGDEFDAILSEVNYAFFGFAVPRKNVTVYWIGLTIYFITLCYASYSLYANASA